MSSKFFQIASTGGVASTSLMRFLEKKIKINTHSFPMGHYVGLLKHERIPGTNQPWHCPPHFYGAFHYDNPRFYQRINRVEKSVFIYSDPRIITLSLFGRMLQQPHLYNMGIGEKWSQFPEIHGNLSNSRHPGCASLNCSPECIQVDLNPYFSRNTDVFGIVEMINNWFTTPTKFPRLLVKSEHLFDNYKAILRYLDITEDSFIEKKERNSSLENSEYKAMLDNLFQNFLPKYEQLPAVIEINSDNQKNITEWYNSL